MSTNLEYALRDVATELRKIREALERLSPPPPKDPAKKTSMMIW